MWWGQEGSFNYEDLNRDKGKHKYSSNKHKSMWRLDKEALKYKYLHKGKLK